MSEEIKFMYMWLLVQDNTIEFLKEWMGSNGAWNLRYGIPGRFGWHSCSGNKLKNIIGEK